jgi:hypothetical protein
VLLFLQVFECESGLLNRIPWYDVKLRNNTELLFYNGILLHQIMFGHRAVKYLFWTFKKTNHWLMETFSTPWGQLKTPIVTGSSCQALSVFDKYILKIFRIYNSSSVNIGVCISNNIVQN